MPVKNSFLYFQKYLLSVERCFKNEKNLDEVKRRKIIFWQLKPQAIILQVERWQSGRMRRS